MITDKDIDKLENRFSKVFATKQELKDVELSLKTTFESSITKSTNSILSAISDIVESFGTGMKATQVDVADHDDTLNDHERRIEALEKQRTLLI